MPLYFRLVKIGDHHYLDCGINDKMGWTGIAESERTLRHWLPSDKVSEWFERRTQMSAGTRQILKIQNLPQTGLENFANAPKVLALADEETKKFLNQTVVG